MPKFSIRTQLILLFSLSAFIGILIFSALTLFNKYQDQKDAHIQTMQNDMSIITEWLKAAIEFESHEEIESTLKTFLTIKHNLMAVGVVSMQPDKASYCYTYKDSGISQQVIDPKQECGQILPKLRTVLNTKQPLSNQPFEHWQQQLVIFSKAIFNKQNSYYLVTISRPYWQTNLSHIVREYSLSALFSLVISMVLAFFMHQPFTRTINRLQKKISQLSQDMLNPQIEIIEHQESNEFAQLYDGFNQMLLRLKSQAKELDFRQQAIDLHTLVSIEDFSGNIIYANDKFISLHGVSAQEVMGNAMLSVKALSQYPDILLSLEQAKAWQGILEQQDKNDNIYWAFATISPDINKLGQIEKLIIIRTDITALIKTERELELARNKALASDKAKSRFLANMSHEIRTPLNAISGFCHLALKEQPHGKVSNYLSKINISVANLGLIINDILDFSKIEANRLTIEKTTFDLHEVIEHIANTIAFKASEKDLDLLFDIAPNINPHRIGDPLRLGQILLNLCNNAVKFTEKGKVCLKITSSVSDQNRLNFTISDSGIGISKQQQKKLFHAFSQADESTTRKFGGTGLGLAISQRLIHLMGGDISVSSELGNGTTFSFHCHLPKDNKNTTPMFNFMEKDPPKQRIALLAFEDSTRHFCQQWLKFVGFECIMLNEAKQLMSDINKYQQRNQSIDLLLIEMHPEHVETITQQIHSSQSRLLKTLFLVPPNDNQIKLIIEGVPYRDYLTKPLLPRMMLHQLLSQLEIIDSTTENHYQQKMENIISFSGARILLVEDNPINQELMCEILKHCDCHISIAKNGQQAVEKTTQQDFDCVLMDIQMPIINGIEATKIIRQQEKNESLPILAMTANAMRGDKERCLKAGMNDHISKPINTAELFSCLQKWLPHETTQKLLKQEESMTIPVLPHINTESALKRLANRQDILWDLLFKFKDKNQQTALLIEQSIKQKQTQDAILQSHTLAGLAGSIGALKLQKICKQLEQDLKKSTTIDAEPLLEQLKNEFSQVMQSLELLNKPDQPIKSLDKQTLINKFSELKAMLEEYDTRSLEVLEEMNVQYSVENIEAFYQAVQQYNFEKALELYEPTLDILKKAS